MNTQTRVMLTFLVLVILIAGLYFFTDWFSKITGYFTGEEEKIKLIECLSIQGVEWYTSDYCADCEKQRELLGSALKRLKIIDCGFEKEFCPNIKQVPAWYIPNTEEKINYGFKTIEELKQISGCQ